MRRSEWEKRGLHRLPEGPVTDCSLSKQFTSCIKALRSVTASLIHMTREVGGSSNRKLLQLKVSRTTGYAKLWGVNNHLLIVKSPWFGIIFEIQINYSVITTTTTLTVNVHGGEEPSQQGGQWTIYTRFKQKKAELMQESNLWRSPHYRDFTICLNQSGNLLINPHNIDVKHSGGIRFPTRPDTLEFHTLPKH